MRRITDEHGRKWSYCEGDGSWSTKSATTGRFIVVGCGNDNGSKWTVWNDEHGNPDHYEHATLRAAFASVDRTL
jgi:hypothetical protein